MSRASAVIKVGTLATGISQLEGESAVTADELGDPEAATTPADPFGWDIILILLALPILVGSLKQPGKARWILLGASLAMFLGAALIAIS